MRCFRFIDATLCAAAIFAVAIYHFLYARHTPCLRFHAAAAPIFAAAADALLYADALFITRWLCRADRERRI